MLLEELLSYLQNLINDSVTQKDIADALGVTKQAITNRKTTKPFEEYEVKKIINYLLVNKSKSKSINLGNSSCIPVAYLPNVYISAGYGIDNYDEHKETMFIDAALMVTDKGNHINPATCEIVRVSGNSMSPEYRHGDRVIIDRADTELADGHIYAFRFNGDCYVKEINLLGDKIKCISLNKEYDPFYVNRGDDFIVLGRILPRIRL